MKKYTLLFVLVVMPFIFTGCVSPNWQGNLDCNLSVQEMARKTLDILTEEKYKISTASDILITADSEEWFKVFIGMQRIRCVVRIQENKIFLTATLISRKINETYGTEETLNDNAGENLTEYWRVRRKLEKICNNTMIVIDTRATNNAENENNVVDDEEYGKYKKSSEPTNDSSKVQDNAKKKKSKYPTE